MESICKITTYNNNNNNNNNNNDNFKNNNKKEIVNNKFEDLVNYSLNDSLLYLFFRLIQADYNFYQLGLSLFQGIINSGFKSHILVPRGSFAAKTGLKSTMDLDLDFILPREFIKPEQLEIIHYPKLLYEINQIILSTSTASTLKSSVIIKNLNNNNFTRTLKYSLSIEGIEIFIDLFPKFISNNGKLVSLSHFKDEKGLRYWEYSDFIEGELEFAQQFKEYQIASILFIKLYKNDIIEKELIENPNKESMIVFLKGYHLCLAVQRISEKYKINKIDNHSSKFSVSNIYNLIINITEYLSIAYDNNRFNNNNHQYQYNKYTKSDFIFNNEDPFYLDLKHLKNQDFNNLINHLNNLKNKIKIIMNTK